MKLTARADSSLPGTPEYQWQVSTNGGKKWKNCSYTGNKTKILTVKLTEKQYDFLYRCAVIINGQKMYSNTVRLETPYTVTVSPAKRTLDAGETGKFKTTAIGAKGAISYQWQQSKDGGQTWKNTTLTGCKKETLSVKATNARYGMMFRCMVTAGNGKVAGCPVWINPTNWKHFQYQDNGKEQWIISKYKQDEAKVTVPAGFDGRRVIGIGTGVFKGKNVKTVVIPPSVTTIGASAFENCGMLTAVTLSDNVKKIEKAAFKNCGKLANMKIENK